MNNQQLEQFILEKYDAELLNKEPSTDVELLDLYQNHTDFLYKYALLNVNGFLYSLNNEIRAIFGHLAQGQSRNDDKELGRAYGHFRRLNLDALKYICNKYDAFLFKEMKKQYRYDYRNVDKDYLKKYSKMYFDAKELYIKAQKDEQVGSDRSVHNVIKLYHEAVKSYILLRQYYEEKRVEIVKIQRKIILVKIRNGIIVAFGILVSSWGVWPFVLKWLNLS